MNHFLTACHRTLLIAVALLPGIASAAAPAVVNNETEAAQAED